MRSPMSTLLFQLHVTGFVVRRKNIHPLGSHYTDSSNLDGSWTGFFFFFSLMDWISSFHDRCISSEEVPKEPKPNIIGCSVISSDVSHSQCFQIFWGIRPIILQTHTHTLKDRFISAPFFLSSLTSFPTSILLVYHLESRPWSVEWEQWNCWWFMVPHNVRRWQLW